METLVAASVVFFLAALTAGSISARGATVSGQLGNGGQSHFSGSPPHPSGLRAVSGRFGAHLKDSHPFHHRRFDHRRHFRHKPLFWRHHHFSCRGFFPHHPFGFHSGFCFRQQVIGLGPSFVVISPYPQEPTLAAPGELARWDEGDPPRERPLISLMLRHHEELKLSLDQVRSLAKLRSGFEREAIRHEADVRLVETELATLLEVDPVEEQQVKAKLQEIERLRADLRFARIRAIEQGKALLSLEQRTILRALVGEPPYSHLQNEVRE